MKELFQALHNILAAGQDAALVSILAESGSAPRGAGAHMLVADTGRVWGTIGGGAVEYHSEQLALTALKERRSFVKEYHLSRDLGMICGGAATVFYQFLAADDTRLREITASALRLMQAEADLWLILRINRGGEWQMGLYSREEGLAYINLDEEALQTRLMRGPTSFTEGEDVYYVEPIHCSGRVLIFGGGHVAQALAPLLAQVDFSCWVLDDRVEFATAALFPTAKQVIHGSYEDIGRYITMRPSDYVVVMTHGHAADYTVQKQAMQACPAYIGVIGSRNKIRTLSAKLAADGFSAEEISRVHAPIGLSIQAETPAEIAVSIAAELIGVRAEIKV